MKKLFTEPEIEILNFLCDGVLAPDSVNVGGGEGGVGGGDGSGELPLP